MDDIFESFISIDEYKLVNLGEICDIVKGSTSILKAISGSYPLVTTGEERKSHASFQFETEAVCIPLVSSTGHGHASIKRVHYQSGKFALGSILAAVVPKDNDLISAKFLYFYLNNFKNEIIVPLMKGMANVTLSVASIKSIPIVMPSLEKQLELVLLMEKCENLRNTLRKSKQDAESMIQATLTEVFKNGITAIEKLDTI